MHLFVFKVALPEALATCGALAASSKIACNRRESKLNLSLNDLKSKEMKVRESINKQKNIQRKSYFEHKIGPNTSGNRSEGGSSVSEATLLENIKTIKLTAEQYKKAGWGNIYKSLSYYTSDPEDYLTKGIDVIASSKINELKAKSLELTAASYYGTNIAIFDSQNRSLPNAEKLAALDLEALQCEVDAMNLYDSVRSIYATKIQIDDKEIKKNTDLVVHHLLLSAHSIIEADSLRAMIAQERSQILAIENNLPESDVNSARAESYDINEPILETSLSGSINQVNE
ncbi:MAG: hypothetical protein SFT91_02015 [Rickettsiaceae bacterium]|nr:hypothetical protein [Rickettsiaceae bacterium]